MNARFVGTGKKNDIWNFERLKQLHEDVQYNE
jgi:hypothetical protein